MASSSVVLPTCFICSRLQKNKRYMRNIDSDDRPSEHADLWSRFHLFCRRYLGVRVELEVDVGSSCPCHICIECQGLLRTLCGVHEEFSALKTKLLWKVGQLATALQKDSDLVDENAHSLNINQPMMSFRKEVARSCLAKVSRIQPSIELRRSSERICFKQENDFTSDIPCTNDPEDTSNPSDEPLPIDRCWSVHSSSDASHHPSDADDSLKPSPLPTTTKHLSNLSDELLPIDRCWSVHSSSDTSHQTHHPSDSEDALNPYPLPITKCRQIETKTVTAKKKPKRAGSVNRSQARINVCSQCPKRKFKGRLDLLQHLAEVHEGFDDFLTCSVCQEQQNSLCELIGHLKETHESVGKNDASMFCVYCHEKFVTEQMRDLHLRDVHSRLNISELFCEIDDCPEKFKFVKDFNEHLRTHLNESDRKEIFTCEMCGRGYLSRCRLDLHKLFHISKEEDGYHHCPVAECSVKFLGKNKLFGHYNRSHIDTWNRVELYSCDLCKQAPSFLTRPEKQLHVQRHLQTVTCLICHKVFFGNNELVRHQYLKHGRRNPVSKVASRDKYAEARITATSQLKMDPVTDEVESEMKVISKNEDDDLNRNCLDSSGNCEVLLLACAQCPVRLPTFLELERHKAAKHKNKIFQNVVCEVCGLELKTKHSLGRHMNIHAPGEFQCVHCGKQFNRRYNLKTHVNLVHLKSSAERPFICDVCGKGFISRGLLNGHKKTEHGEFQFHCTLCSHKYKTIASLNLHMTAKHSNKKFTCPWCNARYSWASKLTTHVKKKHPEKEWGFRSAAANVEIR